MTDYQGSTIALTDTNQTVAAKYSYTPYGTTTATGRASGGNPFRWIGGLQLPDNHGDYALGYRQYDPNLARFTQPDPSGQEANPYAYGLANPLTYTDPVGLVSVLCNAIGLVAGIGVGAVVGSGVALGTGGAGAVVGAVVATALAVPAVTTVCDNVENGKPAFQDFFQNVGQNVVSNLPYL